MKMLLASLATTLAFALPAHAVAQAGQSQAAEAAPADNPEIAAMFEADQADRSATPIDWSVVGPRDEARLARIAELLEAGEVRTGQDFHYAAVLYQHGQRPAEYLTAHLLAVAALARGREQARQIATATLDRYLLSIGQPQVLGTQFTLGADGVAQQNFDENAVPESLRAALGQSREALEERRRFLARFLEPAPSAD